MKVSIKKTPVRYNGKSYREGDFLSIKEEHFNDKLFLASEDQDDVNIGELTEEELKKVKNDDIRAYLDGENVEYEAKANKKALIALVLGENVGEEEDESDEESPDQE